MIRRPPTEISGDPMCFDRKFLKNDFGVRRAPISDFWPFFFDFRSQKFRPLRKNGVFRGVDFFEKTTKTTVLFFRGALLFSQKKRTNVTNLPFK